MITEHTYQSNNEIETILDIYHVNNYNNIAKRFRDNKPTTDNRTIIEFKVKRRYQGKALTITKQTLDNGINLITEHGAKKSCYFIPKTELDSGMFEIIFNNFLKRCKPSKLHKILKKYVYTLDN